MKKTLKHLLPALFLAAVMALLTGCTKSVDLLQYADVTFDGASGNATTAWAKSCLAKARTRTFGTKPRPS